MYVIIIILYNNMIKKHDRTPGRFMMLSSKTGKLIGTRYLEIPNGRETYMSPIVYICYYPRREGVPVPDRTWEERILPIVAGCWWYLEAFVVHVSRQSFGWY